MKITVRKIAELAGVSRGTVDRALNDRPGVKPEIKQNILRIAADLNYSPNMAAKALAYHKKPVVIGILMPPREITFFDEIRKGLHEAGKELEDLGVRLHFKHVDNREPKEAVAALEEFLAAGVSGLLVSIPDDPDVRITIDRAFREGVPTVTFNSDVTDCKRLCFVGQNLYESGRIAAGLFSRILTGGSKLAVVTGNMQFHAHRARVEGFVRRVGEMGAVLEVAAVLEGYDNYPDTYRTLQDAFSEHPDITGIYMATGSISACLDFLKTREPREKVHIICNDILPLITENMEKGIIDFTVVQDPFNQGYKSLMVLYDYLIYRKPPEKEFIFTETGIKIFENL